MKRSPPITGSDAEYIQDLFRKGRTIAEVQSATNNAWSNDTLMKLKVLAGRAA